jgi:hypothetical protein
MTLVEECSGLGELSRQGTVIRPVRYRISRYQAKLPSGLPVPGLHRIEGTIDSADGDADLVGAPLTLRLEDGRALGITLADAHGRVLTEGHGPRRCVCC